MSEPPAQSLDERVEGSMIATLGIGGYEHPEEDLARARMPVLPAILQPFGIVHGGAYSALAETVASWATYDLVGPEQIALGQSNDTSFLRPVSTGTIHAEARLRHRSRRTLIWDVEMRDNEGELAALAIVAIASRPAERASG